jgi:hypothetical protein
LTIGGSFHYERVLLESDLWITFSTCGENGLDSRVVGNSARKRKSTYFLVTAIRGSSCNIYGIPLATRTAFRMLEETMKIKLLDICHARSGDKGDAANVGLIAREERYYPIIKSLVTRAAVKKHFKGICFGPVERFELPNLWALNFLLHNTLGGGGTVSLKQDAQGKTLAAALLRMEIEVPPSALRPAKKNSIKTAAKSKR